MEHSGHQQPPPSSSSTTLQQQQTKPRKHSTISLLSITGSSPISSMMLHIDPRLIPKNLFKFHKVISLIIVVRFTVSIVSINRFFF